MIPEKRFSFIPVVASYLGADALPRRKLRDYEQGGVAIGDPTQGLRVQPWECYMVGDQVRVRPYPDGEPFVCFTEPEISRLALAFDQNMRPVIGYVADGLVKLWWYDAVPAAMVFTSFPDARDPVLLLDDKRPGQRDFSDVLFFYMKREDSPTLYMRAQRDRYGVEYAIGDFREGTTNLVSAGMTRNLRLKFSTVGKWPRTFTPRRDVPPYPPGIQTTGVILDFRKSARNYVGTTPAVFEFDYPLYKPPISDVL